MKKCPCCSDKPYTNCCGPFIEQQKNPTTPEQLMRSRYVAYTQANIPYLEATMRGPASQRFNLVDAEQWAKSVLWQRLVVHSSAILSNTEGTVSFTAYFRENGINQKLHENSLFRKVADRWFYVDTQA